ncbi:hypothetical protein BT93_L5631 [Corymbia citriodora subsp. variegata]|uniref:NB-ARC domain-containing protein n=1 Tax=Corymbia citriodora subsp. variegata TaxID=360336 RepID=A0A8T0CRN2_CORYI|nr:hypothetical protein BT93_L5631 [Corymbia citriodora subsp. variegata]
MLSKKLERKKNCVLILDDVWEHLDLEEVGIPTGADGFKLVLTTRSFDVCRQMQCQKKIKINPLSQEEAESLFMEEFGREVTLKSEIEAVMKSIVRECAGLPIGVITMARSMREVTDAFEWRDSLAKLKESCMGQIDMEEKVLMKLKFSYDRLGDHNVQQCFLSCALYPEDNLIHRFELVEFFIDQGLIGGLDTRKGQFDRGLTILNKLENVCLLEKALDQSTPYDMERLKMHDLIKNMALHIMSATSIVKPGKGLMRIPPEECWTEALEKVSLMENKISEFPPNISPNCPRLSTILLNDNRSKDVVIIPKSFFRQFWGLKVLNLSRCYLRKLPKSISKLVNLRALLLSWCSELRRIPYLGKLTSLRKLDVRGCHSLDALEGLEKLMNLRYLNLTKTCIERLPKGILNCLPNLQLLEVPAVIEEEDVAKLVALETFKCYLKNVDDFNKCVRFIEQSDNPRYYDLRYSPDYTLKYRRSEKSEFVVEVSDDARFGDMRSVSIGRWGHAIVSVGGECAGIFILVPRDVQYLWMEDCDGMTSLSGMGHLEELEIAYRENLGVLGGGKDDEVIGIRDSPAPTPTPLLFPSLRVLKIHFCPKLKYLFGHGSISNLPHLRKIEIEACEEMVGIIAAVTSPPPHPLPAFPSLEEISIHYCYKMKRAVEFEWMPHFPNLRRIEVVGCKMEEIIGGPPSHASVEKISLESLSASHCKNMRKLFPHELLLHVQNLQEIWVSECEGMVEMISGAGQGQEGSIMTPVNNTPPSFQPPSISLPNLRKLKLEGVPQLKSICEVPISCGSMEGLKVYECPELKAIPLELRLRDIDNEGELPYIWVEDEEKWKTLMWDDPNAQAILQPYLRKGENARDGCERQPYQFQLKRRTPNAIELDTEGNKSQPWRWRSSEEMISH